MTPAPGPSSCNSSARQAAANGYLLGEMRHNHAMKDPRALLADFRSRVVVAPALGAREDWLTRIDALAKALEAQHLQIGRLRQDIEDAEHTRDAAAPR